MVHVAIMGKSGQICVLVGGGDWAGCCRCEKVGRGRIVELLEMAHAEMPFLCDEVCGVRVGRWVAGLADDFGASFRGCSVAQLTSPYFLCGRRGRRVAAGVEDVVFYVADAAAIPLKKERK